MIEVTSTILESAGPVPDVLAAYEAAALRLGADEVFLLESRSGPQQDCRESILGIGRLATVSFEADRVTIAAEARLAERLAEAILTRCPQARRTADGRVALDGAEAVWEAARALAGAFRVTPRLAGFQFGFLACLGYDAARLIERLPHRIADDNFPPLTLQLFQHVLVLPADGTAQAPARLVVNAAAEFPPADREALARLLAVAADGAATDAAGADAGAIPPARADFTLSRDDYLTRATTALYHIRIGDIYQVQIGHELRVESAMTPLGLYRRLRQLNPSPYMFLCRVAGCDLIGASPENYIRLEDGAISMRPIAGTIGKTTPEEHARRVAELTGSRKENAEHIMLVDLCRNDIARVATVNSLDVPSLMAVEEFSHLFHLVSTVSGRLAPGLDVFDLIRATFPAGTMTGAPKIRAMEIIEDLEVSRRGAYAGAIGLIGPGDYANMALCIRMASHRDQVFSLRACAGIVADSTPEAEWRETIVKMKAVYKALTGEELAA